MNSSYRRSSNSFTPEEYKRLLADLEFRKDCKLAEMNSRDCETVTRELIYSSLISATNRRVYTHKIIKCGDYYQVYTFNDVHSKKDQKKEKLKNFPWLYKNDIKSVDIDNLSEKEFDNNLRTIETKNIMRAKFNMQRLIKTNEKEFKTFITLTFEENVKDISKANNIFKNFKDQIKRVKRDFKYVCVPEFQKRGAVHYHLLTNIDYTDFSLLSKDEYKHHSKKYKMWNTGRYIKYWNKGFSLVKNLDNIDVVGYLTKYMTKDIDNRLWGKRRYLYSQNLNKPEEYYLNINDANDNSRLSFIELFYDIQFSNLYYDKLNEPIYFTEYKSRVE